MMEARRVKGNITAEAIFSEYLTGTRKSRAANGGE